MKIVHYAQSFDCEVCHEKFGREEHLLRHKSSTHEVSKFCCDDCGKNFNRKDSMQWHKMAVHKENEEFVCHLRDSIFNFKK